MKGVPAASVVVLLAWVMLICAATTASVEITASLELVVSNPATAKTSYSNFIATLRVALKDPSLSFFGIPVLRMLSQSQYMYVKLVSAKGNSTVLAIDKKDIYLVGYAYKNGNEIGARFFKDIDTSKYETIFPDAKIQGKENIGIKGVYDKLQSRAGVGPDPTDRMKVQLGMTALGSYIDKVSVTQPSKIPKDEAKLLLIAIQMVSEAVRFKYIEDQVKGNIPDNFNPDYKVISLEVNWGKLSKAIESAKSDTESFKEPFQLVGPQGNAWIVTNVKQIQPDMGLLNAVGASELLRWLLDHDVLGSINYITA